MEPDSKPNDFDILLEFHLAPFKLYEYLRGLAGILLFILLIPVILFMAWVYRDY